MNYEDMIKTILESIIAEVPDEASESTKAKDPEIKITPAKMTATDERIIPGNELDKLKIELAKVKKERDMLVDENRDLKRGMEVLRANCHRSDVKIMKTIEALRKIQAILTDSDPE